LGSQAAQEAAAGLELASLEGEGRADDTIEMLQTLATDSQEGDLRAKLGLVQAYVAENDIEAADAQVAEILADDPASLAGRMMLAGLHTVKDETDEAEAIYREIASERPELREPHQALIALLARDGREDEARAALDAGIEATSRDGNLIFTKAGLLVNDEDFDGAIELYQELYDHDTSNQVVANNLASLLSSHRDDDASLEHAFAVARRLRGTEVPYFQDTYGWLLSRRGDNEQALTYLEPAAEALVADPLTHYHLGMTYVALEQFPEARAALERAIEIAGPDSDLPQMVTAQAKIDEIDAMPAAAPAE
jgi:Tfp pilus assembly protein PilF